MILLAASGIPHPVQGQGITAQLEPNTITTEQAARLTITIQGDQDAAFTLPEVEGLVFHRRGQTSQFQMINGAISSSVSYNYLVQGVKPGTYTIPPIETTIDGTSLKTKPITCTVVKDKTTVPTAPSQPGTAPKDADSENLAFMVLTPKKSQGYLGEIVPAQIKAYFRAGVKVNLNTLPVLKSDGVLLDTLGNDPNQQRENLKGVPYTVLTWDTSLTGVKEGTFQLALEANATMLVRSKQRRQLPSFGGGLFNDDFFGDFFDSYENRPIKVVNQPFSFTVKNLPSAGKPEGFSGAIGNYGLHVRATPQEVDLGEPVNLTMTVEGTGNFDTVEAPRLTETKGLKTYSPSATFNQGVNRFTGSKVFEQAVVVSNASVTAIPPVSLSFFDPESEQYRTVFSDPIQLSVKTSIPPTTAGPIVSKPASGQQGDDVQTKSALPALAPVKLSAEPGVQQIRPLFLKPWYLAIGAACFFLIISITVLRLYGRHLATHPEATREKAIDKMRKETMAKIEQARSGPGDRYLVTARQALREFLALIWNIEPDSLTTSDMIKRLDERSPLTDLFHRADQAVYGSMNLQENDLERLHQSLITTIATMS